ncbi:uncharacterized protein LOC141908284 [Tubulanus polymorphus]|uniref:uncharacterized protein LOC141908284 n=1 Tax=Tubulanus polymorphus TaxID=672921 RepID=UPI003DA66D0F
MSYRQLDSFTPFFMLYRPTREEVNNIVDRVSRPTTAHCRRSRSYSEARIRYESEENQKVKQMTFRDYARTSRVPVPKHYGGTRKTITPDRIDALVTRINKPTKTYCMRVFSTEELMKSRELPPGTAERGRSAQSRDRSSAVSDRRRPMTSPTRSGSDMRGDQQTSA